MLDYVILFIDKLMIVVLNTGESTECNYMGAYAAGNIT